MEFAGAELRVCTGTKGSGCIRASRTVAVLAQIAGGGAFLECYWSYMRHALHSSRVPHAVLRAFTALLGICMAEY